MPEAVPRDAGTRENYQCQIQGVRAPRRRGYARPKRRQPHPHGAIVGDVASGDVEGSGEKINIEKIIEHEYRGIRAPTERRVRVELIQDGLTGNCARVRTVTLFPQPSGSTTVVNQTLSGTIVGVDLIPRPTDVYRFSASPGTQVTLRVDTVSATTTFDPLYYLGNTAPTSFATSNFAVQDDDFPCTFPPPGFSCPTGTHTLPADPDGVYFLSISAAAVFASPTGGYVLQVNSSAPITPLVLVENDAPK